MPPPAASPPLSRLQVPSNPFTPGGPSASSASPTTLLGQINSPLHMTNPEAPFATPSSSYSHSHPHPHQSIPSSETRGDSVTASINTGGSVAGAGGPNSPPSRSNSQPPKYHRPSINLKSTQLPSPIDLTQKGLDDVAMKSAGSARSGKSPIVGRHPLEEGIGTARMGGNWNHVGESLLQPVMQPIGIGAATGEGGGDYSGFGRRDGDHDDGWGRGGSEEEEMEDEDEVYIPGLTSPTLFAGEIPQTDSLEPLINRYLPQPERPKRDLSGNFAGHSLPKLIATNSWRAVAGFAKDSIISAEPERTGFILEMWYLRFHSLSRLRLHSHLSFESSSLFSLLPSTSSFSSSSNSFSTSSLKPTTTTSQLFPLKVFQFRMLAILKNDIYECVDGLFALIWECRKRAAVVATATRGRKENGEKSEGEEKVGEKEKKQKEKEKWEWRAERLGIMIAGYLADLKDYNAASTFLDQILHSNNNNKSPSPFLLATLIRLHITYGVIPKAESCLSKLKELSAKSTISLREEEEKQQQSGLESLDGGSPPTSSASDEQQQTLSPNSSKKRGVSNVRSRKKSDGKYHSLMMIDRELKRQVRIGRGLILCGRGEWEEAAREWGEMAKQDPKDALAINNLAVVSLFCGRLSQATELMQSLFKSSPQMFTSAEPLIFNLATLIELGPEGGNTTTKVDVLKAAAQYTSEGLVTTSLKL